MKENKGKQRVEGSGGVNGSGGEPAGWASEMEKGCIPPDMTHCSNCKSTVLLDKSMKWFVEVRCVFMCKKEKW